MAERSSKAEGPGDSPSSTTWQRQLVDIYSARRGRKRFHPSLTSEEEYPSDDNFVDFELIPSSQQKSGRKVKRVPLETCYDLLGLEDYDDRSIDHVLVSGEAGVGKTTIISRLAYQWAKEKRSLAQRLPFKIKPSTDKTCFLYNFEYVFIIDLRKCEPDMCLVDAIESQLLTNVSKQHLEGFLTNHSSECLYIFDGYNEVGVNDKILKSNLLCDGHVVVTIRPNKVDTFYENHKEYAHVTSEGFSETSITRFVEKYFANSKETSDMLLKTIFDNPVAKDLSRFPLLLSMMCGIWKNDSDDFPSTISELYHHVLDQLARDMKAREPQFEPMTSDEFHTHIDQIMVNIGKTALDGLLQDSKLIFKEEEFSSLEVLDQATNLGIIPKGSKVSDFDKVDYVSFAHKTFQEYCAAAYLSNIADKADHELFKSYLSQMDISEIEYVLRFCCGTSQKAAEYVLAHIADVYKLETQKEPSTDGALEQICRLPLLLLYESESKFGVTDQLHSVLSASIVDMIMCVGDDPEYRAALQYFIERCDTQKIWTECVETAIVYMLHGYMGTGWRESATSKCERYFELLSQMPHLKKVKVVHLALGEEYRQRTDEFYFQSIESLTTCKSLQELTLRNYKTSVNKTSDFVNGMSHDIQLHLECLETHFGDWTAPESMILSNLLQVIHSNGGSIRKLEVVRNHWQREKEDCNMEQVINHVTPFIPVLERIMFHYIGPALTKKCIDELFDGITQAGQKLNSQDSNVGGEQDEAGGQMSGQPKEVGGQKSGQSGEVGGQKSGRPEEEEGGQVSGQPEEVGGQMAGQSEEGGGQISGQSDEGGGRMSGQSEEGGQKSGQSEAGGQKSGQSEEGGGQMSGQPEEGGQISGPPNEAGDQMSGQPEELEDQMSGLPEEITCKISDHPNASLPLKELQLSGNNIAQSIHKICDTFKFLRYLKTLSIWLCDLTETEYQTLGPALPNLPNLQYLLLMNTDICNSLKALILGINHSKLTYLDLRGVKLTEESKQHFSQFRLPVLEHMDLSANDIDSSEAKVLFESLHHMPKLTWLDLGYNKIDKVAFEPSQSPLSLTYLNLTDNTINSDGASALASSFRHMSQLESINISDNRAVGPEGWEELLRNLHYLPKLTIFSHPCFPMEFEPTKLAKMTGKLKAAFQRRRESPPRQTLLKACKEAMKEKGIWTNAFYCFGIQDGALRTEHIQEIVRVAATFQS